MTSKQEKQKRTFYLKLSTIEKLQQMADKQNRKLSVIIDMLIEAA